jgi:hypothetical protein
MTAPERAENIVARSGDARWRALDRESDEEYNQQRTHSGKYCYGKTPMATFLEARGLVQSH